jgi:hypothetical protein
MTIKDKVEPIVIAEIVELFCEGSILSNIVISKNEIHNTDSIQNTFCFDCSKTDAKLFEKSLTGSLNINSNIPAVITDVQVKLDGSKTITVQFMTAVG